MVAVAESGIPVLRMDDVPEHLARGRGRAIAITFDDGFRDFAEIAWPILHRLQFSSMVYLPTDCIDGAERWEGAHDPPRPLMTWDEIRRLASNRVDFGNHTATHPDLSSLDEAGVEAELGAAGKQILRETGDRPLHTAYPYGRSSDVARQVAAREHRTSVGTRLAAAGPSSDLHDLPRLEMYYFKDLRRWRAHLEGQGASYLLMRRVLRSIRSKMQKS